MIDAKNKRENLKPGLKGISAFSSRYTMYCVHTRVVSTQFERLNIYSRFQSISSFQDFTGPNLNQVCEVTTVDR